MRTQEVLLHKKKDNENTEAHRDMNQPKVSTSTLLGFIFQQHCREEDSS